MIKEESVYDEENECCVVCTIAATSYVHVPRIQNANLTAPLPSPAAAPADNDLFLAVGRPRSNIVSATMFSYYDTIALARYVQQQQTRGGEPD